jgi:hypothetical protein
MNLKTLVSILSIFLYLYAINMPWERKKKRTLPDIKNRKGIAINKLTSGSTALILNIYIVFAGGA